jgi:dihydrofolate reductase
MTVGLIWAQAANGVIGSEGALPWHLPEDLGRFKALTMGSTVVMGRRTWESLPARFRPLPGRRNVVLTRTPGWRADGAIVAGSLEEALDGAPGDVWVIGGATVYGAAVDSAEVLVITELAESYPGDTVAPDVGPQWAVDHREPPDGWLTSRAGPEFAVTTYTRKSRVAR